MRNVHFRDSFCHLKIYDYIALTKNDLKAFVLASHEIDRLIFILLQFYVNDLKGPFIAIMHSLHILRERFNKVYCR